MIRLARPELGVEEEGAVTEVLRSGQLVQGPRVKALEQALAASIGAPHVVAVSNGTAALHVALLALGLGPGHRIAVPTYSWPATANVVELSGATPVFIDIEPVTCGMDPALLARAIVDGPPIHAVMPVHAFGGMARMREICEVAERHGIPVIEDAACALGARLEGVAAGAWGTLGSYSFHPRKAVTTGEGGAVACPSDAYVRVLRALRNHGLDPDAPRPDFVLPGFNYRMSEMQAAVGVEQLKRLPGLLAARRTLARHYDALLRGSGVGVPAGLSAEAHVYQSYVVQLPAAAASRRAMIIDNMRRAGIEVTIGTYHIPLLTYYRRKYGYAAGSHPVGEQIAASALALPMHARVSEHDAAQVVAALRSEL